MAAERQTDPEVSTEAAPVVRSKKKLVVIGAIMALEGIVIFAATKFLSGGPATNEAAPHEEEPDHGHVAVEAATKTSELEIAKVQSFNNRSGKAVICNITVSCLVATTQKEAVQAMLDSRKMTITDRLQKIIRSADPTHFGEPGLETLRRQIHFEMNNVMGNEKLIEEILIPEFVQARGNL